ncbi:hypothetical protein ACFO3J_13070 [Streptomyces polygonati]|uniref:ABM domain-containing protein n=1 Tax=Streptomyces polygonati TaxID=1617087 RepID=A0ABV8HNH9_9ACTN
MPIAAVMTFKGATLEQYDQALADMGFSAGGAAAPGELFHFATAIDGGIQITEIWESPDQFEAFSRDVVGPAAGKAGITELPEVSVLPVHNHLSA